MEMRTEFAYGVNYKVRRGAAQLKEALGSGEGRGCRKGNAGGAMGTVH